MPTRHSRDCHPACPSRTVGLATPAHASASSGLRSCTAWNAIPPSGGDATDAETTRRRRGDLASAGILAMLTSSYGRSTECFMSGTSAVPPAMTRGLRPRPSAATASSSSCSRHTRMAEVIGPLARSARETFSARIGRSFPWTPTASYTALPSAAGTGAMPTRRCPWRRKAPRRARSRQRCASVCGTSTVVGIL